MAKVREDLEGSVLAVNETEQYVLLTAGEELPEGYFVGGHAVEGGDVHDQTPPWATRGEGHSVTPAPDYVDPIKAAVEAGATPQEILAAVAERLGIDLPAVSEDDTDDSDDDETEDGAGGDTTSSAASSLVPPPLTGPKASKAAWRDYASEAAKAAGLNIEIPEDAKLADIVDALKTAGIRTE